MNHLDNMAAVLLAKSQKKSDQILGEAKSKAEQIVSLAVEKAREEAPEILQNYKARAHDLEKQGALQEKMELQRSLLSVKQSLVDQALTQVRRRYDNQSDEEWIARMKKLLNETLSYAKDEKPEIVVAPQLEKSAHEAFDHAYRVVVGDLTQGFIFSFETYDFNYEAERIFTFQREEMELLAAHYLLGDDADERH